MDFDLMISNIRDDIPFKYARYGDGEWNCILGKHGANCDGHQYFPELGARLKEILESQPDYFLGLQTVAIDQNQFDPEFRRLVEKNTWCDNEILHRASINGYISLFFDTIKQKSKIFIGGDKQAVFLLNNLYSELGFMWIPISEKDCWMGKDEVIKSLSRDLQESELKCEKPIVLLSAGMMSEFIIDVFHKDKFNFTFIDCGSVFDPYSGVKSRSYHHDLKI